MTITRRHMAVAGAFVLGASAVLPISSSFAESVDATAVANAVAALTKAMLAADKAGLESLVDDQLSYGHSGGVAQDKAAFVDVIASKKTIYKSIVSKTGILQVWQKQGADWKLLARQAFAKPA